MEVWWRDDDIHDFVGGLEDLLVRKTRDCHWNSLNSDCHRRTVPGFLVGRSL